jgi:hypothetical protein
LKNASIETGGGFVECHGAIVLIVAGNARDIYDAERAKEIYTTRSGSFNQKIRPARYAVFGNRSLLWLFIHQFPDKPVELYS